MTFNGKPTSAHQLLLWDGTKFVSGFLTNSNIDPSAAIAGTKISPNFGSQQVSTTNRFATGTDATATFTLFSSTAPYSTHNFWSYSSATDVLSGIASGGSVNVSFYDAYNTSGGNGNTIMGRIGAVGPSSAVADWNNNGVLEQAGPSTSAWVFSKISGSNSGRATTGRIYQSGVWSIGNASNTSTSAGAQAGLTGPLLNISAITGGSLSSVANQSLLYNSAGTSVLQGHAGVNLLVGLTTVLTATSTSVTIPSLIIGVSGPSITAGTGVPSSSPQNGSLFLRTDGTSSTGLYTYQSGAWSTISGGGGGGGGSTPTGTGFVHVTGSSQDGTAKLVFNADVDSSAAIDGNKIVPNFGAQTIITTGAITAGSATATAVSTGLLSLSGKLIASGITTSTLSGAGQGVLYFDSVANTFLASENGGVYGNLGVGGNYGSTNISTTGSINSGLITTTALLSSLVTLDGKLLANGITTSVLSASGQGVLYFDSVANTFLASENGGVYGNLGVGGNYGSTNITTTGSANLGSITSTSSATSLLTVSGKIISNSITTSVLSNSGQGIIYFDGYHFKASENGSSYVNIIDGYTSSVSITASNIDWSAGDIFYKTISSNTTFTFSNSADGQTIIVIITAGSGDTSTWPTTKWPGGIAPTQTSSGTDIITFVNQGGTIYGSYVQGMA